MESSRGEVIQYYESGEIKETATYKNGMAHGFDKRYDEDGQLVLEAVYENGVLTKSTKFKGGKPIKE